MYLRTLSWSSVSSKKNIHIKPSIQIFCKDLNNKSVYVKLDALSTIILGFTDVITEENLIDIYNAYQPSYASASSISDDSILLRDATLDNYKDVEKEINGFEQDPHGLLSSFWKARNIKPYDWIFVEKYEFITKKYTNCDIEIKTSEEFIHKFSSDVKISTNKLFWDIEVLSPDRNFTDAKNPTHEIFMISAISEIDNNPTAYILTTKNTDTFDEAIFKKYETEKDLIIGFFELWRKVNPDRCMNYNGDSYDMPYILKRAKLLDIKILSLSKLLSPSIVISMLHPSPIGIQRDETIISSGVEKLDLITYLRRFYPGNTNYRLETTGILYLGEGKSGLEIEEMFQIVESNDPVRMKTVSWYSYKDSILLYELLNKLDIENKIENICNDIYCTSEELLRINEENLISRMFYHADFGTVMIGKLYIDDISYLIPFKTSVYRNLYVNKYDELFDLALSMNTTHKEYVDIIRDRIKYLPTYMKAMIVYSNYIPLDIRSNLESLIKDIKGVIAIDDNFIYTLSLDTKLLSLTEKYEHFSAKDIKNHLSLVDKYDYLFVITPSSRIFYKNDILTRIGLHTISRPKYEYMKIAIDSYLLDYIAGEKVSGRKTTTKELSLIDKNFFIVSDKIKPLSSYKDKRLIKHKISENLSNTINITTWVNVKYIHTEKIFKIITKDGSINEDESYILNYKKYVKDINEIYKTLDLMIKG